MFARSALFRGAAKTVRNARQMSGNGSTAEHLAEVAQWKKFTAGEHKFGSSTRFS